jgi:dipeptidyl aminopeptidase/acylaminoacyl peptidase
MNHYRKTTLYIGMVFSVAVLFYSCKNSFTNPQDGPTEGRILFIKSSDDKSEICSIKPDGTDLQIIASHSTVGEFLPEVYIEAQWSPDKSYIAIVGGPKESPEYSPIWLMDNQGDLLYRLTWNGYSLHWSSDGSEILFARSRDYSSFLSDYYIVNINTLSERVIVKADSIIWVNADWSADGNYILTSEMYLWINEAGKLENSDLEVVLIQISDKERQLLTDTDVMDSGAQWSPDESKIAYISGIYTQGYQIKLMNNDGTDKTTLVDTLAGFNTLHWSPDGDKIAFNMVKKLEGYSKYARGSDLFVVDINCAAIKQLTNFATDSIHVYVQDWK